MIRVYSIKTDAENMQEVLLKQHFKLKYKGKKTANSFWLNYGRCAVLQNTHLIFVSQKDQVVVYDLTRLHSPDFENTKSQTGPQLLSIGKQVQDLAVLSETEMFVLTEDHKVVHLKQTKGKLAIHKEAPASKDSVSSCVETTICCGDSAVIVIGYRETANSNCYYLLDHSLELKDTVEVVLTVKRSPQDLHIHKASLFTRENILHLFALNIACSVNVIVVHRSKLHPVIVNTKICGGTIYLSQSI